MMADPASGRCWLFYYPSLTSLLVLLRPVDKPNFNILDPQGPVPRKCQRLAASKTLGLRWHHFDDVELGTPADRVRPFLVGAGSLT